MPPNNLPPCLQLLTCLTAATCKKIQNSSIKTQEVIKIIIDFTEYSELDGTQRSLSPSLK